MAGEEYATVFHVSPMGQGLPPGWPLAQLRAAGVTHLPDAWPDVEAPERKPVYAGWFDDALGVKVELPETRFFPAVRLTYPARSIERRFGDPTQQDPDDGWFVDGFREACVRLRPFTAYTSVTPGLDLGPVIAEVDLATAAQEPWEILDQRFGLTYLDADFYDSLDDFLPPDRDQVPVDTGRLVFAGHGQQRWW